jgi:putative effector of murein hydrolase LrgA (UPF0299 family)
MAASGASVQPFLVLVWPDAKAKIRTASFASNRGGKMIAAFAGIFACQLIGEFLVRAFALPLPGPVVGMFLLFAALLLRGGQGARAVPAPLGGVADGLLSHLSLLFVPASVGLMRYFDVLEANGLTLIVAIALSTALAQAATAITFQFLARSDARGSGATGPG